MEKVRFLQIEPTTRCNFTCGFCSGRKMVQSDISDDTFAHALATFPDLEHIELQGEGESLMHPRIFEMIGGARARGVKVSFITNGSYLSAPVVEKLLDLGIEKVSVSFESADSETFRSIRGGKLEKVVHGIETLVAARQRRGLDRPVVGMSITVLKRTRDHLGGLIALYRQLGLDGGVTLQPLERKADYASCYDDAMTGESLSDDEVGDVWVQFLANSEIRKIQREKGAATGFFDELMEGWGPGKRRCPWLETGLYVDRNGSAAPCCMVKKPEHSLGTLTDGVGPILERRAALRTELAEGRIPAPCDGCELANFAVIGKRKMLYWGVRGLVHRLFGRVPDRKSPASLALR